MEEGRKAPDVQHERPRTESHSPGQKRTPAEEAKIIAGKLPQSTNYKWSQFLTDPRSTSTLVDGLPETAQASRVSLDKEYRDAKKDDLHRQVLEDIHALEFRQRQESDRHGQMYRELRGLLEQQHESVDRLQGHFDNVLSDFHKDTQALREDNATLSAELKRIDGLLWDAMKQEREERTTEANRSLDTLNSIRAQVDKESSDRVMELDKMKEELSESYAEQIAHEAEARRTSLDYICEVSGLLRNEAEEREACDQSLLNQLNERAGTLSELQKTMAQLQSGVEKSVKERVQKVQAIRNEFKSHKRQVNRISEILEVGNVNHDLKEWKQETDQVLPQTLERV
eukprot:GEMP01036783.1.p1 GENE.GEMP01036783.1~~GEMP01036783.1.p1  ORF type:complete len:341 (+),score=90.81 GEMP01036783.1:268-1290(+)